MDVQEVEVVIDHNGQVHLQVRGAKGNACLELTRELEEALGGQIAVRQMTAEAYEAAQQGQGVRQQQMGS